MSKLIGYARTSTPDQRLDLQIDALAKVGVRQSDIYSDQMSGGRSDRPGLKAALAALGPRDTLTVWKLDRLGRSVSHLAQTVQGLTDRGIGFWSLTEAIDTGTTSGRLLMHVLAAVAEAERSMSSDRIKAGMSARKSRGACIGRPFALSADQIDLARQLHGQGHSLKQISRLVRGRSGKHPAPSTVHALVKSN